jgi:hypothetical protein
MRHSCHVFKGSPFAWIFMQMSPSTAVNAAFMAGKPPHRFRLGRRVIGNIAGVIHVTAGSERL